MANLKSILVRRQFCRKLRDMSDFTEFSDLKTLALDATNSSSSMRLCCQVAAFMISASPYLELLELDFKSAEASLRETVELELPSMSTHKNLKEVKLSGFKADVYAMDFLAYLVGCSVSLHKINITAYRILRPDDAENCNQFVQELRKCLNSDVELIFQDLYWLNYLKFGG